MLLADAIEYVRWQSDAQEDPVVSDEEIERILLAHRITDRNGYEPGDESWSESYWLPRAIACVFERKVMLAAQWVDANADGTSFATSQAVDNFRRLEYRWRRRSVAAL
jgi:hypothetical protein